MNELFQLFSSYGEPLNLQMVALSLLLAFVLAMAISATYVWTFRGLSYSRSFVHALALGGIIAAMLMLAINNSIAAGLGIAGSLAIIRFRTAMRDPLDMVFMFASMGAGIASGLRAHLPALLGTALFCGVVTLLVGSEFGQRRRYDGVLRFKIPESADSEDLRAALRAHTRHFALITLREVAQGQLMEYAYQVELKDESLRAQLVRNIEGLAGVQDVSLMLQDPTPNL